MSKRNIEKEKLEHQTNNVSDTFSFLELDKYLSQENISKNTKEKSNKKKKSTEKEDIEKNKKLKIKPNENIAREQTSDDFMYIEKEENLEKEEPEKEEKKEIIVNKEKNIPKKNIEKKKIDKRIVTLKLEKDNNEEKLKNEKKDSDKKGINKENKKDGFEIESIINKIKDKDPKAYTPIILPFDNDNNNEEKSLKEEINENNENKLFVFQFPRQIPIKDLNSQLKTKEEENINEEPNYDENGFLISPEFKNSFQDIKDNTIIGKLVIMKSGKIKIKMGDIYFDINEGSMTKFAQYSAIVTKDEDSQAYILGQPFNKKLIVTPEFD